MLEAGNGWDLRRGSEGGRSGIFGGWPSFFAGVLFPGPPFLYIVLSPPRIFVALKVA